MKAGIKNILNALFFIVLWAYYASYGKYILIYQENHSLFLFDKQYFYKFLYFPGGLAEYLSAFFTQFFYSPILGAFLIALIFLLITFFIQSVLNRPPHLLFLLSYIPALIFLVFFNQPEFGLTLAIAFTINLGAIVIFNKLAKTRWRYCFAVLAVVILYFTCAGVYHLFWISVVLYEILYFQSKSKKIFLPLFIVLALYVPTFAGQNIFHIHFNVSYFRLLGDSLNEMPPIFFALVGFFILVPIGTWLLQSKSNLLSEKMEKPFVILGAIFMLTLTVAILYRSYDKKVNQMICTAHEARANNWEQVLKISADYDGSNYLMAYYTNLALLKSGKMENNLFEFNQELGTNGLFFTWDRSRKKSEHGGLLYYELGFINEAHHWAFESLISNGENAPQLKMLALTNLINGKRESAAKYLLKLDQSLFYSNWVEQYMPLCEDSTLWAKSEFIREKRAQMPDADFFMNLNNLAPDLVQLLKSNPQNEAAFRFMLSFYLLSNQVDLFAETLKEFHPANQAISSMYQQALLIFLSAHPDKAEEYKDFNIDLATKQKFSAYANAMRSQQPRRGNIPEKFRNEFQSTYWYYLHFVSPHGNKVITKN
ncbi:DUF6057 family protein [Draconibacterium sp. IB214405]|uniref:DUF6057 family protein n=1 Tax=Draconibacterium sp. IB214405 TaxID=3097352 RepID=UPI002A15335E|nr:DUF6057 family protein [Draconibacterium sp. IB214405]MDX8340699.1 DUF6057 family protein [Draconibacterium sp. IB214405]